VAACAAALAAACSDTHAGNRYPYLLVRTGYTVGRTDISTTDAPGTPITSASVDREVRRCIKVYDSFFARAFTAAHPYRDWFAALDPTRAKGRDDDEALSLQAPFPSIFSILGGGCDHARGERILLHMRPGTSELERGRANVGFALAQAYLGDDDWFTLPASYFQSEDLARDPAQIDASAIAVLVLRLRGQQRELGAYLEGGDRPDGPWVLGRWIQLALRRGQPNDEDWKRLASASVDRTRLWSWVLVLTAPGQQRSVEAELRRVLPLNPEQEQALRR
jgi:hypothetical protein